MWRNVKLTWKCTLPAIEAESWHQADKTNAWLVHVSPRFSTTNIVLRVGLIQRILNCGNEHAQNALQIAVGGRSILGLCLVEMRAIMESSPDEYRNSHLYVLKHACPTCTHACRVMFVYVICTRIGNVEEYCVHSNSSPWRKTWGGHMTDTKYDFSRIIW